MDTDIGADAGTSFFPLERVALNMSAEPEAEDGVALGDLIMEPWEIEPWGSAAPLASMPMSAYASKSGHERQVSDSSPCQCLRRLVILVDEIESIGDRNGLESLDGALASHKEALGCGAKMLSCLDCTGRIENMIILTLMVYKLVRMCSNFAEVCFAGHRCESSTGTHKIFEKPPLLSLQCHPNTRRQEPAQPELNRSANTISRMYSIDSSDEYLFIMAGILRFQLLQLSNLTGQLRRVSAPLASDTISRRLAACNEAVEDMLSKAGLTPPDASEGAETI